MDVDKTIELQFHCFNLASVLLGPRKLRRVGTLGDEYTVDFSGDCAGIECWFNKIRSVCTGTDSISPIKPIAGDLETFIFHSDSSTKASTLTTTLEGRKATLTRLDAYPPILPNVYRYSSGTLDILYDVRRYSESGSEQLLVWMALRCSPSGRRFDTTLRVSAVSRKVEYVVTQHSIRQVQRLKTWLRRSCSIDTKPDDFMKPRGHPVRVDGRLTAVSINLGGKETFLKGFD
ncbi:hypothetical protein FOZ61_010016 [Perkinsus olseni]|uniref:Uncharacterized protein n=1 Tax=Perkinsus olseni TaxID=32597 RepID=A0A7J6KYH4_PEROL|nr:hypothetical protein FOZ61_010016 [Perkinsus olseni]KAF4658665.1 hypothetical protein FOL46_006874 [Perkinsus olseni]